MQDDLAPEPQGERAYQHMTLKSSLNTVQSCPRWTAWPLIALLFLLGTATNGLAQPLATYGFTTGHATFGLTLPAGAASSGVQVGSLATQTDVKTKWPDGSIRFAVVTVRIPSGGSYAITAAPRATGATTQVWPSASVELTIAGTKYTAPAPTAGSDQWLSGPLVSETRALVIPAAGGTQHPFLRVLYDIRSYAGGGQRVDVSVQNTLDVASADRVTYNVAIVVGGTVQYSRTNVEHPYMMRWRKTFLTGGLSESAVTPDFEPVFKAKALPRFLSSISGQYDARMDTGFDILQVGTMSRAMGATGGRPEIGPYPDWTAQYIVFKKADQGKFVLRNGDLGGSWSAHITKPDGVSLISIDERPDFMLQTYANAGNKPANNMAGVGFIVDGTLVQTAENAHQPSLAYVPYLVTGDRYYADEMAFWASFVLLSQPPADDARRRSEGLLQLDQPRGIAWGLRNLADAAAYLPDAHPMKAYFVAKVRNNLAWADQYAATHITPLQTVFAFGWATPSGQLLISGQWQNNYVAWAIDHANRQGFSGGGALVTRITKLQLRLFTSAEWPRQNAAPYYLVTGVRPAGQDPQYYTTLAKMHEATAQYWGAGEGGFPSFAGAYGIDARLSLLLAVSQNPAAAQDSINYLMSQPGMRDYLNNRPGWALDPSSLTGSAAAAAPTGLRIIGN